MRGTIVVLLLLYAAATAAAGSRWLPTASWPLRAPTGLPEFVGIFRVPGTRMSW